MLSLLGDTRRGSSTVSASRSRGFLPNEGPPQDLFESKLHPPVAHAALVSRVPLVDRLDASDVPITVIAAPPGYGKTTLSGRMVAASPFSLAWLSIDRHDNDLGRLVPYTAAALGRVDPIGSEVLRPSDGR